MVRLDVNPGRGTAPDTRSDPLGGRVDAGAPPLREPADTAGSRDPEEGDLERTRERHVSLPAPAHDGRIALEQALWSRRSGRAFAPRALSLGTLAQLLWATQGATGSEGGRTTPSACGSYPLELHVLSGEVEGLAPGHYRYLPRRHMLLEVASGDRRSELARLARNQHWLASAPAVLALTGVPQRSIFSCGPRGTRYVHIEAGCAAQNLQLESACLGLVCALVGEFQDQAVARLLALPDWEQPLVLLPVGWPAAKRWEF